MNSGLNWTDPDTLSKADPYLALADMTDCASFRLPATADEDMWWLVLVELSDPQGATDTPLARLLAPPRDWLQVPTVYSQLDAKGKRFRFCTARIRQPFFKAVLPGGALADVVTRYQLCLPVEYPVKPLALGTPPSVEMAGQSGPVIALIDGGLALAHTAFLDGQGESRIAHFWRQDDHLGSRYLGDRRRTATPWPNTAGQWQSAVGMGYGAELDRAAINATMAACTLHGAVDEGAVYQRLGLWDLDRLAHHGTHVLSLAAGPYRYAAKKMDPDRSPDWGTQSRGTTSHPEGCDLVAVQLAWANVLDTSGRSGDAHILDALLYIWSRCDEGAPVTVNLSWGNNAGAHDGSSILEKAMLEWCELRTGQTRIVVPAGNSYQARGHANEKLEKDERLALNWRVLPEGHTPSFLELWFDRDLANVEVEVSPPGGAGFKRSAAGVTTWTNASGCVAATLVLLNRPNLSLSGSMALVALEPTAGGDASMLAPSGTWAVIVTNWADTPLRVCAYIERNDVAMGLFTGAKQSYFEDEAYNRGEPIDDPGVQRATRTHVKQNASPVRRTGNFNRLSTDSDRVRVLSVGGILRETRTPDVAIASPYSPRWEDADDARLNGRKKAPDTMQHSDDSLALWGLRAAGSRSGAVVRLVGTSSAVPLAVREIVSGRQLPSRPEPPGPGTGGGVEM